jgi:hypothetical protein
MIQTAVGLPNRCSRCGKSCTGQWWAEHEDAARSGAGLCDGCAHPAAQAAPDRPVTVSVEPSRDSMPRAPHAKRVTK